MSKTSNAERTVRPSEATKLIARCFEAERPVMIWGPPGIGKSDLIATIGKDTDRLVIDMRLLLMEPTDLKGIPYFDPDTRTMRWSPSSELPKVVSAKILATEEKVLATLNTELTTADEASRARIKNEIVSQAIRVNAIKLALPFQNAILFLDEINAAPPSVQAAAYQLILNKRIGEYVLPKGISIVCAGNRNTDKGVTFRMPSPLANRLVHIEMEHNFEDWQKWAVNNGVHSDVVGFLSHLKQHLYNFDPKSSSRSFATPRTWTFVSDLITDNLPDSSNTHLVAGTVGEGVAIEFMQHRRISAKMPKPEDVLNGVVKELKVKEISAMYSLTVSLCYTLQETAKLAQDDSYTALDLDKWHKYVDNFFKFMMDNFQPEMVILGAKTALRDYKLPINHRNLKHFKDFYEEYGKYVLED